MPKAKDIPSLQTLCLKNMANNVRRHTSCYLETKSKTSLYSAFQRIFSDRFLEILVQRDYTEYFECTRCTQLEILLEEWEMGDELARSCLEFVFNRHLKRIFRLQESRKDELRTPPEFILTLLYNCRKISVLNLSCLVSIEDHEFSPLVTHSLKNVVHLDLSSTRVGDETFVLIMRHCRQLIYLDLEYSEITDEGIKMLCGNYRNAKANDEVFSGYCENPKDCSARPPLKYFNIRYSSVTNSGLISILQHLPSLHVLKYEIRRKYMSRNTDLPIPNSVSEALALLNQNAGSSVYGVNLKKLCFTEINDFERNIKNVVFLCPLLKSLKVEVPIHCTDFSYISHWKHLTEMAIHIDKVDTIESKEFQSLLYLRGRNLTFLKLTGPVYVKASSLLNILGYCPNLQKLYFDEFKILPPTATDHPTYINEFKCLVSLAKLETFIVSHVFGYKSEVSRLVADIVRISPNIKYLRISYSRVDVKGFSPMRTCNALYNLSILILDRCNISKKFLWELINMNNKLSTLFIVDCDRLNCWVLLDVQKYIAENNIAISITDSRCFPF